MKEWIVPGVVAGLVFAPATVATAAVLIPLSYAAGKYTERVIKRAGRVRRKLYDGDAEDDMSETAAGIIGGTVTLLGPFFPIVPAAAAIGMRVLDSDTDRAVKARNERKRKEQHQAEAWRKSRKR